MSTIGFLELPQLPLRPEPSSRRTLPRMATS